jgi:hypothetical protein
LIVSSIVHSLGKVKRGRENSGDISNAECGMEEGK